MRIRTAALWLVFALTAAGAFAQPRPMSISEMVGHADLVFVGDTVEVRSEWNSSRTMIFTIVRQRVADGLAFKGTAPGAEIVWTQPGGQVENIKTTVFHGPIFVRGERALLFLVAPERVFVVPTVGGDLGKVEVARDGQEHEAVTLWRERGELYPTPISKRSERVSIPLGELGAFLSTEVLQ
jgi:hypothetical protein